MTGEISINADNIMITVENKKMFGWTVTGLISMALFLFFVPLNIWIEFAIAVATAAICGYFLLKSKMKFPWNRSFFGETYSRINEVGFALFFPFLILLWCVGTPIIDIMQ